MNNTQKKFKILIAERFSVEGLTYLKKNSKFEVSNPSTENIQKHLAQAEGIIVRSKFTIDAALLDKTPELKVIVTATSGYDHIDLIETEKRNIKVMYTPDANVTSAAELTWGLILACQRHLVSAHREIKAGKWQREPFLGHELAGRNLGIIGLGRIGQKMAKIANAFDMKIFAFDPYQEKEVFQKLNIHRSSYEEVLKQSDVLTFHVPLTSETRHMLNRSHFEYIHPDCVVINASRGSVIHEEDLADALLDKKISCAGLDVFKKEPPDRNSKLLKCQNLIMTPHLGAYTEEAFQKASLQAAIQIEDFFLQNRISNSLPLKNDWGSLLFQSAD